MYGLVNKAIHELIEKEHGESAWEQICARAGLDDQLFISHESYPDDVTYNLIAAASETLDVDSESLLEKLGEHWILHTAHAGYGHMLESSGKNLGEFLINLPNFHTRVQLIFPKLKPPHFECAYVSERSVTLSYHTHRAGLTPFLIGL